MPSVKRKKNNWAKVMWLTIILSAALLMPVLLHGKYRSRFSRTIEFTVYPYISEEGVPSDGNVVNNLQMSEYHALLVATPSIATASVSTATVSAITGASPSVAAIADATPSQDLEIGDSTTFGIIITNN